MGRPAQRSVEQAATPASPLRLSLLGLAALLAFIGFCALGTWQVHRRAWKLDLIRKVDTRLQAPPAAAPTRAQWPTLDAADDEYRKLCLSGEFLHDHETLVQAVTRLGAGDWVMTPLRTTTGELVLVNRGFVPPEQRAPAARSAAQAAGPLQVCGLLRLSEPHGAFLRRNDPAAGRWFSRDVAAIAAAQALPAQDTAPYFLDADAAPNPGGWPAGGLTVVSFHNSHLVYAITWYGLALLVAGGTAIVARHEWRLRQPGRMLK
ncbi:SURF1 family protein [Nevskia soli]|uniref:SURF1 family protein n=1 Tax=Nevskia soli TaxID=418856 RepID=UPI0004A76F0B|nr:SURF1 family protein [Nevskia soli]